MKTVKMIMSALIVLFASNAMAADRINLCTGAKNLVYHQVGIMIAEFARGGDLEINVIADTGGTAGNLERSMYNTATEEDYKTGKACHAWIGQPDALAEMKRSRPSDALKVQRVLQLHREYVQVACSAKSGIKELSDLRDNKTATLAIGGPNSGTWITWQNIVKEDPRYKDIPVTAESGMTALAQLETNETQCALFVSGIPNKDLTHASDFFTKTIKLVPANDRYLTKALDFRGQPLYTWKEIPVVYKKWQSGTFSDYTPWTISWNAELSANKDRMTPSQINKLIEITSKARPSIIAKFGD